MKASVLTADVIILGGGLIGMSLACALGQEGLETAVIEAKDPALFDEEAFDGRTSAIAYASRRQLEALGVWQSLSTNAGAILDIRIVDGDSPLWLHYDHREVGREPMGHIVENRHIRGALMRRLRSLPAVHYLAPAQYAEVKHRERGVSVTLEDGRTIEGRLLVIAEGRGGSFRDTLGIRSFRWDYHQTAIVCTVEHEKPHQGVAVEKFLPAGPFAMLPMADAHRSSIVWSEAERTAPLYLEMEAAEFLAALGERFGDWLGKLKLAGPRWSYPLTLDFTLEYAKGRAALIGDAAHGIHPTAGQGFNLGLRDVAALSRLVLHHKRLGLDVGSAQLLAQYRRERLKDNLSMIAVTDGLNRLFSNRSAPLRALRRGGLAAVEQLPQLKRYFMRHAMGIRRV